MKHWHRARESLEFALQLHGSKCNGVYKREPKAKIKKEFVLQVETKKKVPEREEHKEENKMHGRKL